MPERNYATSSDAFRSYTTPVDSLDDDLTVQTEPVLTNPQNPMMPYKFSPDEQRVLEECNRESFYQRSLPFSTVLGFATYMGVKNGFLTPNIRLGAGPKVTMAVIVGYFLGKFSYQQKCAEKLMALPDSYIGQLLRQRSQHIKTSPSPQQLPQIYSVHPNDIYSDAGPESSLNLDTDRPNYSDESYNANVPEDENKTKKFTTYDDLRKENRKNYPDVKADPYRYDPPTSLPPPPPIRGRSNELPEARPARNKYGDIVD